MSEPARLHYIMFMVVLGDGRIANSGDARFATLNPMEAAHGWDS